MSKYLHIFRFHDEDTKLYELEMKLVFKREDLHKRYFLSDELISIEGSAFGLSVLEVHCHAENFDDLKQQALQLPEIHGAKLDDLSIGFMPRASFNDIRKLLPSLKIHANLKSPENIWYLTRTDKHWYFGREVSRSVKKWAAHRSKPQTMSSAIPHILAHTITYVLFKTGHKSLIDFCCGSGTFLLEAASLGMKCTGLDINKIMIEMSRENLNHFGYHADLHEANAVEFIKKADCGIADFPYGLHCKRNHQEEKKIILNIMKNIKTAVLIAASDLSEFLKSNGFVIKEYFTVPAVNITRHVHFVSHDRD